MNKIIELLIKTNKKNGQLNTYFPKRKLPKYLKEKDIKSIRVSVEEFKW